MIPSWAQPHKEWTRYLWLKNSSPSNHSDPMLTSSQPSKLAMFRLFKSRNFATWLWFYFFVGKEILFESFDGLGRASCLVRLSACSQAATKARNAKFPLSKFLSPLDLPILNLNFPWGVWNCRQTVFMSHHLHFLLKLPLPRETLKWGQLLVQTILTGKKGFPKNKVCSNLLSSNVHFLKTFCCNLSPFLKHSFQISFINSGPVHFSGSLDYKVWEKVCSSGRQYHQLHHLNTFKFAWCIFTKIEKEEIIFICYVFV